MDPSLLFFAFVVLCCASLIVPLSKLLGLGPIIGYIAAGILIGPSVLGVVSDAETVLHFSEFGVVMMLFLIGLELRPAELWRMRNKLLGLGGLQVSLTLLAVAGGLALFGQNTGTAIALGMALALSSTAVGLQIMQDRNLMDTAAGKSGFSILLFQDVIVILMIALVPVVAAVTMPNTSVAEVIAGPADGGAGGDYMLPKPQGVWYGAAVIGVFAGMVLGGRLLLRPIFRMIARAGVREAFTAIGLALVVGAALLMGWLGLSAALGAFLGGVLLADSEYRHQLERDIEPFKALLLGLFFISVGMSMDLGVIAENPLLIVMAVLGLMVTKFAIIVAVTRLFGLATPAALLTGILLCQAGEFGFVIFQFAQAEALLSRETVTIASAVIALSIALTPILLMAFNALIAPRFADATSKTGEAPSDERQDVLILGFGRVGQVAHRLLHTQDIPATLIDHDGDHIEFVRQFGNRVFYGEGTDLDLLHLAGAAHARVIIISMDNPDQILKAAKLCKEHFPKAQLIARARNRNHMFELRAIGVEFIERETVRAALAMGREALRQLGYTKERSDRLMDAFLRYDYQLIEETWEHRGNMDKLIKKAEDSRDFLRATLGDLDAEDAVEEVLEEQLEKERAAS